MNIIYLACMYDSKTYKQVYVKKKKPIQAANKFHKLICEGLVANGVNVNTISVIPINSELSNKKYLRVKDKIENEVLYHYISQANIPFLKHITMFVGSFISTMACSKDSVLIYDGLTITPSLGAKLAARIKGIKTIAILTDLPDYMQINKRRLGRMVNDAIISHNDGYILLTKQMAERVNARNKPYKVIEGLVDRKMQVVNKSINSPERKILMYAGGLEKQYGIMELCLGFNDICKTNEELHIYGDGELRNELTKLCKKTQNVYYHGVLPVEEIVREELNATILVNPRPSDGEYTKYSFPSKTMEYMVSGTPVIMCKLAGLPREYYKYLYFFESGSRADIAKGLRRILDKSCDERIKMGMRARNFVLNYKSNLQQAKKIIELVSVLKV